MCVCVCYGVNEVIAPVGLNSNCAKEFCLKLITLDNKFLLTLCF